MGDEEKVSFLAFREGIPSSATELVTEWLLRALPYDGRSSAKHYSMWPFLQFQSAMGLEFGFRLDSRGYYLTSTCRQYIDSLDQTRLAYFVDYILFRVRLAAAFHQSLERTLHDARSTWKVATQDDVTRLLVRVPAAVSETVERITDKPGVATALLRKAWNKAFGAVAEPGVAYSAAVKAVEVYSGEIFSPNNKVSTLGTAIRDFSAKPEKWTFDLGEPGSDNLQQLIGMMKLLWHNQTDRHGSPDYHDVSAKEAQAAVLLATTLVGWFDNGLVHRVEGQA